MNTFEDVNGIVVGGFSCKVTLINPKGCPEGSRIVPADSDFKIIGASMKEEVLSIKLGNGQLLKDCPSCVKDLHGEGAWSLQIRNF